MSDLALAARLATVKYHSGTTVSVCIPARDEEATVGQTVETIRQTLVQHVALVDEVIVIDDGSTDATARVAAEAGATVHASASILPDLPAGAGKGNALWKSLYVSHGDLVCWVDADIRNFGSHFVAHLLEPLLTDPAIGFVKGWYRRPLHGAPTGGGRVTELVARPVLSALFPELTRFVQPLSGEYAGRRSVLESVPFVQGWGVEIALLIDLAARYGIDSLAQCDLGVREHRNRSLDQLAPQAMAVLCTALRRAGVPEERIGTTLVRALGDDRVETVDVAVRERPPMIDVPAYRTRPL